jgi:hypothetical protein
VLHLLDGVSAGNQAGAHRPLEVVLVLLQLCFRGIIFLLTLLLLLLLFSPGANTSDNCAASRSCTHIASGCA